MTNQVSFPQLARQIGAAVCPVMENLRPRLLGAALSIAHLTWPGTIN